MMINTITEDYFCVFANLRELFVKFRQLAKYFQIPGAGSEAVWLVEAGLWPGHCPLISLRRQQTRARPWAYFSYKPEPPHSLSFQ